MPTVDPGLQARRDAAYQRGWNIGAAVLIIVPLVLVMAAPRFWTDDYPLAGLALVAVHIGGFGWLPVRLGEWMQRRIQ